MHYSFFIDRMIQDYSYWEYEGYHTLWDYCIIGSGINGISTGLSILEKEPAAKILIIDRWFVPLGASTRNAGFSCFGSPSEILNDISTMGEDEALKLVDMRYRGLQKLQLRLKDSNAQYERNGGYELFHADEFESVYSQLPYLNTLLEKVFDNHKVFSLAAVPEGICGFSNAIYNAYEGQLHPVLMMEHLKKMYLDSGGKIWTGLIIEEIDDRVDRVYLRSRLAFPVEAKKVIVTTNAFAKNLLPEIDVHGARNHVLVTEPIKGLKWKGCFHYDKGFYYFRNIGNRILLGGGRNKDLLTEATEQFGQNAVILDALEKFLYDHLVDISTKVDFQWSGIIALGTEKLPIIKQISQRVYAGVRCSGMGIALASLIGDELADLVCNSKNESFVN